MAEVTLTRSQAYDAVREYLAEFLRQSMDASLGDVLSDTSPYVWAEGPGDPAVPWDWSNASAVVAARVAATSPDDRDAEPGLPEQMWLPALHPFLDSMWPLLGRFPLARLLESFGEPLVAVQGSDLSPWQRWLNATEPIVHPV